MAWLLPLNPLSKRHCDFPKTYKQMATRTFGYEVSALDGTRNIHAAPK